MNRLRRNSKIRDLVSQTKLSADDLIMPYFVIEGQDKKEPIAGRIFGPIPREMSEKGFQTIASRAPEIV